MKLLLDTHTFPWLVEGNPNLSAAAQVALASPRNDLSLSLVSIWELAIKTSRPNNHLKLTHPLDVFIAKWTTIYRVKLLPVKLPHILHVVGLPHYHRDPFDRLLISQAIVEGMTLVSGDTRFASYPVRLLW